MTLNDNLYKTIHRNKKPLKAIAEEIGMSENYLTRSALPDSEDSETGSGCRFPLKKYIPLLKSTGDLSTLDYIEREVGRIAIEIPQRKQKSIDDVCRATMKAVAEFGELVAEVEKSLNDKTLNQAECDSIQEEGYQAIQSILALMNSCKGGANGTKG